MLQVIIKNETYPTKRDLENLINYAVGNHCICGLCGATGMLLSHPNNMYQTMLQLKKEFCKNSGRQALHLIVSIDKTDSLWITPQIVLELGYALATSQYLSGTQTLFGVHDNTDKLHLHMVINSVRYDSGLKVSLSTQTAFYHISKFLNDMLSNYRLLLNPVPTLHSIDELAL